MKNLLLFALLAVGLSSCQKEDLSNINTIRAEVGDSIIKTHGTEGDFKQGTVANWGNDNYPLIEAKAAAGTSIMSVNGEMFRLNDREFTVIYRK